MSKSDLNKTFALAVLAILLLGARSTVSQTQVSNNQDTVLTRAHDFLGSFYPELLGKDLLLNLHTTQSIDNPWRQIYAIKFDVKLYDPLSERMLNPPVDGKTGKQFPPPENTVLLQGNVWFNHDGWLHELDTVGEVVRIKQNEAIHNLVESHPEWSEAEAVLALKKAGARYGPADREQFLQSIHLEKFEKFLGHLKLESVKFEGLSEPHEGNFASLSWLVKADAKLPDGTHSTYTLRFEPFEGKLIVILHGQLPGFSQEKP